MNRRPAFAVRLSLVAIVLTGVALLSALLADSRAADPLDKDHAAKMAKGTELFKTQVRAVLVKKCLKCHGGGDELEGGFDISDREYLLRGGDSGPAVISGNAKDSLLFKLITHAKKPVMPSGSGKLSDDAIARIAEWIDLGAPYDEPLVPRKLAAWTTRVVPAEARQFWSFQPLKRIEPPAVKDAAVTNPIDRFLRAKLDEAGLKPNPAVSKQQLIRRAYFSIVGLPPTPQEVESFVNDTSADAYDKLLDKLLASPGYGERWGRHWLDLARFAESHGFEHDYDRPNAYHYRDFVIQALNDDLPFDTFVKWQLAGDEYEPNNPRALMATGFLAAGVHSTQITKKEVEKHRYDEMDDMAATTGTAMLGLTIGCARCHDHKFDPIPQRDYYRMVSTFTTTVRSDYDVNLDPAGFVKQKTAFEKEHEPFEAALRMFEAEQLPARLAEWEKSEAAKPERFPWIILDVVSSKGEEGTTFTKLDDGSVLVTGKNPVYESYTFETRTDLTGITAIRLEALAHPSLVKGGPGRANNGNFALSDFRVKASGRSPETAPMPLKLANPRATFEQKGLSIAAAIDDDEKSAWAIDPEFGKDHAAAFEVTPPAGTTGGTTLTFSLRFRNNAGHSIGRPRLAITTQQGPVDLRAGSIPQGMFALLRTPTEKRTAEQTSTLAKWYRTLDPEWQKLKRAADEHLAKAPKPPIVKVLISSEGVPAIRLHTQGGDFLEQTHFLRRGDPDQKEAVASAGFLQVLTTGPETRWQSPPPAGWRTSYRRRALAEWITDTEQGAGHLLARVIVNRLWQRHMGRGIVATPSDFGTRGERPTHPELLDYLASELIRNHWHLKPIHKLILTSAAFRQGSERDDAKFKVDPENKLFWRRPPHRLEAEVIRDSLLAVSGVLDSKMFGPGTLDPASKRRSVYFTVKRSKLVSMMQVFDAPEALGGVAERPTSTVAPQALLMMNNPQVRSWARSMAKRVAPEAKTTVEDAIKSGYLLALGRAPTSDEQSDSAAFVRTQMETYQKAGKGDGRELALADFCQVLMCLNEFVYVD